MEDIIDVVEHVEKFVNTSRKFPPTARVAVREAKSEQVLIRCARGSKLMGRRIAYLDEWLTRRSRVRHLSAINQTMFEKYGAVVRSRMNVLIASFSTKRGKGRELAHAGLKMISRR